MKNLWGLKGRGILKQIQIKKEKPLALRTSHLYTRLLCVNKPSIVISKSEFHCILWNGYNDEFNYFLTPQHRKGSHEKRGWLEAYWKSWFDLLPFFTLKPAGEVCLACHIIHYKSLRFFTTNSFTFISVHVLVLSYTWSVKEIQRSLSERCDEMGRMESEELFFCQSQLIYLPVLTFFGEGIFKENSYWLMLIGFFPTPVKMLNILFTIGINDWLVLF